MWREVWQPGYVEIRLADQSVVRVNLRYRTGIQSEIVGKQQQICELGEHTRQSTHSAATVALTATSSVPSTLQVIQTAPQSRQSNTYCYGWCWQYDHGARTMTWMGATDGREDIWQPPGEPLQRVREGYSVLFATSVPGEIYACVLVVNDKLVKNLCDGILYQIQPGTYKVTSSGRVGGFRWCPLEGYGWRIRGGECR